jgi:hypothetical protein
MAVYKYKSFAPQHAFTKIQKIIIIINNCLTLSVCTHIICKTTKKSKNSSPHHLPTSTSFSMHFPKKKNNNNNNHPITFCIYSTHISTHHEHLKNANTHKHAKFFYLSLHAHIHTSIRPCTCLCAYLHLHAYVLLSVQKKTNSADKTKSVQMWQIM